MDGDLRNVRNNTLTSNIANSNKRDGIFIDSSSNNIIYHNSLINNTYYNAYDTGTDTNRDGIGDTTYPIPGGSSIDHFPLMHPWTGDTPQKGDLNHDHKITPADAAIALQIAAGGSGLCYAAALAVADVSGDGQVTSLDALMILQAAADSIEL